MLRRTFSIITLTIVYGLSIIWAKFFGFIIPKRSTKKRIIINGTFHNPNWFFAHIETIVRSGYGEVILVTDEPIAELDNLIYVCPPQWANRLFSRAGSKFIWTLMTGFRFPADVYVGYHIFPSAITALICARLYGAKVVYQVTSGPLELEGGGWHAENSLLVGLGRPSKWIETLALIVTNSFDMAVVRGSRAKSFLLKNGYSHSLETITGSVEVKESNASESRDIDIVFVGRLTEYKRPDRFLQVVGQVVDRLPECKVLIIGDGPDRASLENLAKEMGVSDNIQFLGQIKEVPKMVSRAKIFVLTSRWEGVSIAMLEAMCMGVVPVVSDVGDLGDFAENNVTGFTVSENNVSGFAEHIIDILLDPTQLNRLSNASRTRAVQACERNVLAARWCEVIEKLHKS